MATTTTTTTAAVNLDDCYGLYGPAYDNVALKRIEINAMNVPVPQLINYVNTTMNASEDDAAYGWSSASRLFTDYVWPFLSNVLRYLKTNNRVSSVYIRRHSKQLARTRTKHVIVVRSIISCTRAQMGTDAHSCTYTHKVEHAVTRLLLQLHARTILSVQQVRWTTPSGSCSRRRWACASLFRGWPNAGLHFVKSGCVRIPRPGQTSLLPLPSYHCRSPRRSHSLCLPLSFSPSSAVSTD